MRVAIVGAGAVGLSLGSFLCSAGASLRLVVRSARDRRLLAEHGFSRVGLFGEAEHAPDAFELAATIADLRGSQLDFMLVCTKTTASAEVADALADIWGSLATAPQLVLCQNGWGNAELFAARVPAKRVFNARIITGFRRSRANAVEITVHAEAIRLGSLHGAEPEALRPLCDALDASGMPCELSPSIERDLWAKMLYNCALNPLGALLGVRYGELAERESSREILESVVREIFCLLEPAGYATHWDSAAEYLRVFHRDLMPPTAAHESSMLQDIRAGRRSEVDSLCGAVSRLGAQHGVDTAVNTALSQLIHALEDRLAEPAIRSDLSCP